MRGSLSPETVHSACDILLPFGDCGSVLAIRLDLLSASRSCGGLMRVLGSTSTGSYFNLRVPIILPRNRMSLSSLQHARFAYMNSAAKRFASNSAIPTILLAVYRRCQLKVPTNALYVGRIGDSPFLSCENPSSGSNSGAFDTINLIPAFTATRPLLGCRPLWSR